MTIELGEEDLGNRQVIAIQLNDTPNALHRNAVAFSKSETMETAAEKFENLASWLRRKAQIVGH